MNWRQAIVPVFLLFCLLLGGASAAGFESNMLLQLAALPVIGIALATRHEAPMVAPARQLIGLLVMTLALIAIQLVPMPPSLWTSLPGRAEVVQGYEMLGMPLPWLPLSLAPLSTVASALWLLPAIAVLLAMLRLPQPRMPWLAWTIIGVTIASVGMGTLQAASSEGSGFYLYRVTNYGVGTGFFSNANHLATLMVATPPFLAALYLSFRSRGSRRRASTIGIVLGAALAVIFVGIGVNRSIAGIGLAVPVLAASALMIWSRKRRLPAWSIALVALLLAASVVVAFTAPFGNNLTGEEARSNQESRYTSFSRSIPAAREFMPVGSGIGTFAQIYRRHEDPATVERFFMNHVHSDYIEVALETGIPGLLLIVLFLLWWMRRTAAVWRADEPNHYARAATIASAAILAHSLVDYPLRTAAVGALFALCCAIIAEPRTALKQSESGATKTGARHLAAD